MKLLSYLSLFAIVLSSCGSHNDDQLNFMIDKVKSEHVPDKRVAIYNVDFERQGQTVVFKGETSQAEAKTALVKLCEQRGIIYKDSITVLPSAELGEEQYAVVNVSVANFRSKPQLSASMETQNLLGHAIRMYKKQSYWYYAQGPEGYLGWVDSYVLTAMTRSEWDAWIAAEKVIYTKEYGHSYTNADDQSEHISDLVLYNLLKKINVGVKYTEVEYPDGRRAFIRNSEYADFNEWKMTRSESRDEIVKTAKSLMGVPYLWGGTSSKTMDCSGFTRMVFFGHGILLPRDASQQVLLGETITDDVNNLNDLLPGDMVFFGFSATPEKKERITHVGIYLGDSEIIHESSWIHIQSLNPEHENFSPWRHKTFMYGKRILPFSEKVPDYLIKNHTLY